MSRSKALLAFLIVAVLIGVVSTVLPQSSPSTPTGTGSERVEEDVADVENTPGITLPTANPDQDNVPATPTSPVIPDEPTLTPISILAGDLNATDQPSADSSVPVGEVEGWNPPALEVPIAHHPEDHYWFIRPVTANYNNFGLTYYPYGSNGPGNDLRIHHGIDISNPIGVEILSAGSGVVIWAGKGHVNDYENITTYGNTVVIEHDFGYRGQKIYTLYAHMSAPLVSAGDIVESGQVIGLIGNTGLVSGPHVHFEVRIDRNYYFSTRNPALWMAPYAGTGTVAGKVTFESGSTVQDVPVTLIDQRTGRITHRTTTYAGFGVTSDDYWDENFVIPDVPEGHYIVNARFGGVAWSGEVQVLAGTTNWVDLEQSVSEEPVEDEEPDS